jgi:GntR family transcriptional regulator, transcriptional repressor for pyruvate dehydrogenase complex
VGVSATLQPIQAESREQAVLAALARFIAGAGIRPPMRLPTERELAIGLGVGRSTIREAIKRWEGLGVVEVRKGSGIYLRKAVSPNSVHVPLTVSANDPGDLMRLLELRRALESEAAALCAERASADAIAAIGGKLDRLEAAFRERAGASAEEDWDFHQAVIVTAENPLFEQILEGVRGALHRFWEYPLGIQEFGHASFPFHRTMFEAIARRDPEAARAEALKLLDATREDLRRGAANHEQRCDERADLA